MFIGSFEVAITFGLYATITAFLMVWLWDTVSFWVTDRIINTGMRDKQPKTVYVAIMVAALIAAMTYVFAYAAVYYPSFYYVWLAGWLFLCLFLVKVTYFPDMGGIGAWGASLVFATTVAGATVLGLWISAYIIVGMEYAGLSAAYSAIAVAAALAVVVGILMILERRRAEKTIETAVGYGKSLFNPDDYL